MLLVVGTLSCGAEARRAPPNAPPLRFAFDRWAGYYPAVVAQAFGILDSLDVRVTLQSSSNTERMLAGFAAGRHDLVGASLADMVVLSNSVPDLRVILCSDESAGADALVVRRGIAQVSALRGRRIGLNVGSFAEVFVAAVLEQHGVRTAEVEFVDVDAADVPALLSTGAIDAGETWDPYLSRAVSGGARLIATTADVPGLIVDCVATRQSVLTRRDAELRRFVAGWFIGLERWRADSAAAGPAIARVLEIPLSETHAAGIRLLDAAENRRRFDVRQPRSFASAAATYSAYFAKTGTIRVPFDSRTMLGGELVPR